jgi:hypothetical protein
VKRIVLFYKRQHSKLVAPTDGLLAIGPRGSIFPKAFNYCRTPDVIGCAQPLVELAQSGVVSQDDKRPVDHQPTSK